MFGKKSTFGEGSWGDEVGLIGFCLFMMLLGGLATLGLQMAYHELSCRRIPVSSAIGSMLVLAAVVVLWRIVRARAARRREEHARAMALRAKELTSPPR